MLHRSCYITCFFLDNALSDNKQRLIKQETCLSVTDLNAPKSKKPFEFKNGSISATNGPH